MRAGLSILLFVAAAAGVAASPSPAPAATLRFACGENPVTLGRPLDLTIPEPTRATAAPLHGRAIDFAARPGRPLDLFSQRGYRIRLDPDRAGLRLNAPGEATLRCRRVAAPTEGAVPGPAGSLPAPACGPPTAGAHPGSADTVTGLPGLAGDRRCNG